MFEMDSVLLYNFSNLGEISNLTKITDGKNINIKHMYVDRETLQLNGAVKIFLRKYHKVPTWR